MASDGQERVAANRQEFLEPLTPEGAKAFADRWLIGESGTSDALLYEAAQHIYSLLGLVAS